MPTNPDPEFAHLADINDVAPPVHDVPALPWETDSLWHEQKPQARNRLSDQIMRDHEIGEYLGELEADPNGAPLMKAARAVLDKSAPVLTKDTRDLFHSVFGEETTATGPAPSKLDSVIAKVAARIASRVSTAPSRRARIAGLIKTFKRDLAAKGFTLSAATDESFAAIQVSAEKLVADVVQSS